MRIDNPMTGLDREPPKQEGRLPLAFPENVTALPSADRRDRLRVIEALLFAAAEPLDEETLAAHLPSGEDIPALRFSSASSVAKAKAGVASVNPASADRTAIKALSMRDWC